MMLTVYNQMNKFLLDWNLSGRKQRFGQYLASNSNWEIPEHLYYSEDSYFVYDEVLKMLEKL